MYSLKEIGEIITHREKEYLDLIADRDKTIISLLAIYGKFHLGKKSIIMRDYSENYSALKIENKDDGFIIATITPRATQK